MARITVRGVLRSGILTEHDLRGGPSLVLLALVDHADASGQSWPSQVTLARETGMSELGVRKSIKALVESELVEIVDAGGPRRSARYRVDLRPRLHATG